MESLLKQRTSARIWVSRMVNRARDILDSEAVNLPELERNINELDIKVSKLEIVQDCIEKEIGEESLEQIIVEADEFLQQVRDVKAKAESVSLTRREKAKSGDSECGEINSSRSDEFRLPTPSLPKLQIQNFDGNFTEWPSFKEKFRALIGSTNLPKISKFSYLQSLLTGDAKRAIDGLALTGDNFDIAMDILENRFGRKERIIFEHIQKLLNINFQNSKGNVRSFWNTFHDLQSNIRSLEMLGVDGDNFGVVLTPMILSRIPTEIRLLWARQSHGREADLKFLMEFLNAELETRERSETYSAPGGRDGLNRAPTAQNKASAAALHSTAKRESCVFCRKMHRSESCWHLKSMPPEDIKRIVSENHLCFRCFKTNHQAKNCRTNCAKCRGRHNEVFCSTFGKQNRGDSLPSEQHRNDSGDRSKSAKLAVSVTDSVNKECGSGTATVKSDDRARVYKQNDSCPDGQCGVHYHTSSLLQTTIVMQLIHVDINGHQCAVLFDSGSDKSYITSSLVKNIKPKFVGRELVSESCFGETGPRNPITRNTFRIECPDIGKNFTVTEIPKITAPMFRAKIPCEFMKEFDTIGPESLKLKDRFANDEKVTIDVLIGLDNYWSLMKENIMKTSDGLVLQESVFGWVLSGSYPSASSSAVKHQTVCVSQVSDSLIRRFWEVESSGIAETGETEAGKAMTDSFRVIFDEETRRYEVDLPWKSNKKESLVDNREQANARLQSLERKFKQNPELQTKYDLVLEDLEMQGIIEEVSQSEVEVTGKPVFYLPHRPVVKESSTTTKVRPVFDASAVGPTGVSLNSCMETGPYLTGNLLDVLLRFRRWKYALVSDITKAFFQIQVNLEDRDVHRFLWKLRDHVRVMRITRVPFGNTSSPFLLNATIKHHLSLQEPSRTVEELSTNIYVDDWLTGADSVKELTDMKNEGREVMDRANMPLSKWCSSGVSVANQDIRVLSTKEAEEDTHKVLGILWEPGKDCFLFDGTETIPDNLIITRRVVLSYVSRVFDPFGFLQPFIMNAKMIFQGLWKLGIGWDDKLPEEEEKRFLRWMNDLPKVKEVSVPRSFVKQSWADKKSLELHVFCDASEKAYGACVYMKLIEEDNSVNISLVIAKGKLAPIKKVTLPRLELLGAVLGARLISYVKKNLFLPENTDSYCWTDSTVVLSWIKSDASRWKTFVANRVTEIQELTTPDMWRHCPGVKNPADILSRGSCMETLKNSPIWFTGPTMLQQDPIPEDKGNECEHMFTTENCEVIKSEEKSNQSTTLRVENRDTSFLPVDRWGDFAKAVRICAYVNRFVRNLKTSNCEERHKKSLTPEEMKTASIMLLRDTQRQHFEKEIDDIQNGKAVSRSSPLLKLKPFIDDNGLLRVKGRLQHSELAYEEKHPIILPKCHLARLLVRREHFLLSHAGVSQMITSLRNKYWIVQLRTLAKQIKRECVACCRHDSRLSSQEPSPLPRKRIEQANPFSVTGIDYAGPLFSSDCVGKKHYVLLFTCAVIRAVHIELVDSLSLPDFLLAFRRFGARRGIPNTIMSDNAKTFEAASKALVGELAENCPHWHFITPRAPWCGGIWERMIKSIKSSLKKTIGLKCQTRCELETTLTQIEACINSRPLTGVFDDIDSMEPLTPSHFLLGRGDSHVPAASSVPSTLNPAQCCKTMLKTKNAQLLKFWDIWHQEYLRNLPQIKHFGKNRAIKVGTLCLVKEDNISRLYWPLGKIIEIFPGKDNITRTVKVKTAKGLILRPLSRICLLELLEDDENVQLTLERSNSNNEADTATGADDNETYATQNENTDVQKPSYVTRAGRTVRPNRRFIDD